MELDLTKPFASSSVADAEDVRQMKIALNRLGYYEPQPDAGINDIADRSVFDALKKFQADNGLRASGEAKANDATVQAINAAVETQAPRAAYIWRTVGDDKVRPEHAARAGEMFYWNDPPDDGPPGAAYGCRCWATGVKHAKKLPISKNLESKDSSTTSKVLTYSDGSPVIDPNTGKPYPQPPTMDIRQNIEKAKSFANSLYFTRLRAHSYMLSEFFHGRPEDYQRFPNQDKPFLGWYTNVTFYNYGAVAHALGYSLKTTLIGGGLYNEIFGSGESALKQNAKASITQGWNEMSKW